MSPPSLKPYVVGMVGMRPESAWGALLTVAFQTHLPEAVIVRDTGDVPLTSSPEFRFTIDLLEAKGITTIYTRGHRERLGQARNYVVGSGQGQEVMALIDDDCFWEPTVAERCVKALDRYDVAWVLPAAYTPNRESGPVFLPWEEDAQVRFSWAAPGGETLRLRDGSTQALFFDPRRWEARWLADYPDGRMGGDRVVTTMMGTGLLLRRATAWEFKSPRSRRFASTASPSDAAFAEQHIKALRDA